ncbi:MAG: hypothetical protein DELT_02623 [Desulfovibrio sp.]
MLVLDRNTTVILNNHLNFLILTGNLLSAISES